MSTPLFSEDNKRAAKIAFIRTFWQSVTGAGVVIGGSGFALSAADLVHLDWAALGFGAAAVVLTGVIAAGKAAGNILVNGLPAAYTASSAVTVGGSVYIAPSGPAPVSDSTSPTM